MHLQTTFLFLSSGLLAAAEKSLYAPLGVSAKRDVMSCEQTYGAGSVACGDAGHAMCFNPSQGQTCCAIDHGYCNTGKYCAPVAGYCCPEGEDLATCAKNAGFSLPAGAATTKAPKPVVEVTVMATATASPPPAAATAPSAPKHSNGTAPHVQVSVARKEQWTLVYMSMGIGVIGLIMATF